MSERRLLGLLSVLLLVGAPVRAQEKERLARREAELTAQLARLSANLTSRDSTRFVDQRRTVVTDGGFHAAFPEWAAAEARARLPELLATRRRRYGIAIDSLLRDTLYVWIDDSAQMRAAASSELRWRMGALEGNLVISLQGAGRTSWITWVTSTALDRWAESIVGPGFKDWLGTTNPRIDAADLRDGAVRELILSPSSRGRRCLDGSVEECELLLQLKEVPDPLLQAYDPADYRGLVERVGAHDPAGMARCVTGREIGACTEILQRPGRRPLPATSGRVRQSLVTFAAARGGDGAWLRLSGATARPVAEQLALLAAMPLDSLLAAWQRNIREERRTPEAGLGTAFLMALVWSAVGSLIFAWRYRWRHV